MFKLESGEKELEEESERELVSKSRRHFITFVSFDFCLNAYVPACVLVGLTLPVYACVRECVCVECLRACARD